MLGQSNDSFPPSTRACPRAARKLVLLALAAASLCPVLLLALRGLSSLADSNDQKSVKLPGGQSTQEFAASVFRPQVKVLISVDAARMTELVERLRPAPGASLSILLHAIHVFGADLAVPTVDDSRVRAVDLLLDAQLAAKHFDGALTLAPTRYGVRVPLFDDGRLGTKQPSAQAHAGQLLSVLASLGVSLDREIRLADGHTRQVRDILDDVVANFSLEGEIAWDAVAIMLYVDGIEWSNKFGDTFSFNGLMRELMSRSPRDASCGGTHDLIALAVLLNVDRRRPRLSADSRRTLAKHLSRAVALLKETQREDGSWGLDWHKAPGRQSSDSRPRSSALESSAALLVTGHHLEWLVLLPSGIRPEDCVFDAAGGWLFRALSAPRDDPDWIIEQYCPVIHATRSLQILAKGVEKSSLVSFGRTGDFTTRGGLIRGSHFSQWR